MNPSEIRPGRCYLGCNGISYAVEEVRDGLVYFRTNGLGTLISIDLDTFSGLVRHEIPDDALKGHGD